MRAVVRIVVGLFAILMPVSAVAQSLPRTILLIDEDTPTHPWFRHLIEAFDSTVKSDPDHVFVYVENLGIIDGFGTENYYNDLHSHFLEKYRGHPIGVIVSHALRSMPYALRLRDELWPGTPVILAGIQEEALAPLSLPPNVTGFTFRHHLQDLVDTAHTLIPGLKQIVLVGDRTGPAASWWRYFIEDVPAVQARFGVIDLTGSSLAELRQRLAKLPDDAAVVYMSVSIDSGTGERYVGADTVQLVSKVSNRPTFVSTEVSIGTGSVGGLAVDAGAIGKVAAQLALRVLNGESASNIPIEDGDVVKPIFDWRELQRWGISESRLPTGSEIRFRPPTAWEQYRWLIILIAVALLAQSSLITGLYYERRRRRQAEVVGRQRLAELAIMNRRSAIGETSASIAHEINQPLTAIVANGSAALAWLASKTPDIKEIVETVQSMVDEGLRASQVVGSIRGMFKKDTPTGTLLDLNDVIREVLMLLHVELNGHGVLVKTSLEEELPHVLADRVQLQQVILNLIRNAVEAMSSTAAAERILWIKSAAPDARECIIAIKDSGPGIDSETLERIFEPFFTTKGTGMGMGLSICRSIVEAHGGRLTVASARSHGSTFQIALPQPS
jgi:signal transduction histidine kinase